MAPRSGRVLLLTVALLGLAVPAGAVEIRGSDRADTLLGTERGDALYANGGDDLVRGLAGADHLVGSGGDDVLLGGAGDDELRDPKGANVLIGGPGRDALEGGGGVDRLLGGPGGDYLVDLLGGDLLRAGPGADRAVVDSRGTRPHGPTRLHLGRGDDTVMTVQDHRLDVIDCGPGHDVVEWLPDSGRTLDEADRLVDCEVVQEYLGP